MPPEDRLTLVSDASPRSLPVTRKSALPAGANGGGECRQHKQRHDSIHLIVLKQVFRGSNRRCRIPEFESDSARMKPAIGNLYQLEDLIFLRTWAARKVGLSSQSASACGSSRVESAGSQIWLIGYM